MSHVGIVELYIDVKEQAEDDTINQIQLQQHFHFNDQQMYYFNKYVMCFSISLITYQHACFPSNSTSNKCVEKWQVT